MIRSLKRISRFEGVALFCATFFLCACSPPSLKTLKNLASTVAIDFSLTNVYPNTPTNSLAAPQLVGTISGPASVIEFFSDADCTISLGQGSARDFSNGIAVAVPTDATTTIYGRAADTGGTLRSGCKLLTDYTKKNTPPANPTFVSITPTSPAAILSPSLVGTSSADTTLLKFYSDASCMTLIGAGSKTAFDSSGLAVNVALNSTTTIYAQAEDFVSNRSGCVLMTSYTHNSVVPTLAFSAFVPASPSGSTTSPLVQGTASANTSTVTLYSNLGCTTSIGTGTKAAFTGAGLAAAVTANSTNSIYGIATSASAISSACTYLGSFIHDSIAPAALTFTSTTPASPSNSSTTPLVKGAASSDTVTVNLFSNVGCTTAIGTGTKAAYEGSGVTATVATQATTTIYGKSVDAAGNASACTLLTSYTHDTTAPTNPSFVSFTPTSPSNSNTTPAVKGLANTTVATVRLYSASTCAAGVLLASGTQAAFEGTGISITVPANSSTSVYAQTETAAMNLSSCTLLSTYVHDNVAPAAPAFASFSPASPSSNSSPNIIGTASSDTVSLSFFSSGTCTTGSLGTGTKAAFTGSGIVLTVPTNSATAVYALATDSAGNVSACTSMATFTHDSIAPAAPVFASTNPVSPSSSSTTPHVIGTSSADTVSLELFTNSACTSTLGTGTKAAFEGAGIAVTVSANTATTIYAKSYDAASNASACTLLTTYTHDSVGPSAPTTLSTNPVSPNNSSSTPLVKGSSSADTVTLNLYSNNTCTASLGTGTKATFEGTGITATLTANQQTTIYVQALDAAGNTSACAGASIVYIHDTGAPVAVTTVTHAGSNASLTASPAISWSGGGTDPLSGFARYEYSIGTSAGDTSIKTWTTNTSSTTVTASGLTLTSGSTYYANVRVIDLAGNVSAVTSSTGWVATGPAAKLAFSTQPSSTGSAGTSLVQQPIVEIEDSAGNRISTSVLAVTIAAYSESTCTTASTSAIVATTNPVTAVAGRATFAGVYHKKAETLYIQASSGALTTACSSLVTIGPGSVNKLGLSGLGSGTAGVAFAPVVTLQDTYGNATPTASDTVSLSLFADGACTVSPDLYPAYTFTPGSASLATTSGVATFTNTTMTRTGTYYVKATSVAGYTASCVAMTISSGAATTIAITKPASGIIQRAACAPLVVSALDSYGNAATNTVVRTVTLSGAGSGTFYDNAGCTNVTLGTFPASSTTRTYYFKDSASETMTWSATATGTPALTAGPSLTVTTSYVDSIFADTNSRCAIRGGSLSCWGSFSYPGTGIISAGSNLSTPVVPYGMSSGVTQVSAVGQTNCAIKTGGELWCWGLTPGDGSASSVLPVQVFSSGATSVSVGSTFVCAAQSNKVYCWGQGASGALGIGVTTGTYLTPNEVTTLTGLGTVSMVKVRGQTVCAIVAGAAYCWGTNSLGQCGNNSTASPKTTPVQVSGLTTLVTDIFPGSTHSCAVVNGGVKCWGANAAGQLGNGTTTASLVPVDVSGLTSGSSATKVVLTGRVGSFATCALVNGGIKCWGDLSQNFLLDGTSGVKTTPADVTGFTSSVTDLALGDNQVLAIQNGVLSEWGSTALSGAWFGNATNTGLTITKQLTASPISGAGSVSQISPQGPGVCVLNSDQSVACAGVASLSGNSLSAAGARTSTLTPVPGLGASSGTTFLAAGDMSTFQCAIVSGEVYCWGTGGSGVQGTITPSPTRNNVLPAPATKLAVSPYVICAILNTGALYCWGSGSSGAIGVGNTSNYTTPQSVASLTGVTDVSTVVSGGSGTSWTCAVASAIGYCWGDNATGQLGDGTLTARTSPTAVVGLTAAPTKIVSIAGNSSCALLSDQTVQCWGAGLNGALGDGNLAAHTALVPVAVTGLAGVTDISPSNGGFCALLTDTSIRCWGVNSSGGIGNGTVTASASPIAPTGYGTASAGVTKLTSNKSLTCALVGTAPSCWGDNSGLILGAQSGNLPYLTTPTTPTNWP